MNRSPLRAFLLVAFVLACFALSPQARAVCQEGCFSIDNTVLGDDALLNNTGFDNTAIGSSALLSNTTGTGNAATGVDALSSNTTGSFNTANGAFALEFNTTGSNNTATGVDALFSNTTGFNNTANGAFTLVDNRTGSQNTANGYHALAFNTTGRNNTASGFHALSSNTTGSNNIAVGYEAGRNLTTGSNNIDIGNRGVAGESQTIRIGNRSHIKTFIAGIRDVTTGNADAIPVLIDSAGQLGTMSSSRRFKEEIKPMDRTSEAILGLKPVTFHYKSDSEGTPQFGLIAEEVAEVNPDLVVRDEDGEIYTVRYEAVNAMLLNEFLKEHRKVEEETEINRQQQASIARLEAIVKEQALQIQKVTAQLAAKKAGPRMVSSD